MNAIPPDKAPGERARCAEAHEEYRVRQAELAQAARANDLAEGNLRLAYEQARIAFAQTVATVLAFVAAALAAIFAGVAVCHAKRSADADNAALKLTRRAAVRALKDAHTADLRFQEQMAKTREMVEFAAKSSRAMEQSATATRSLASRMRDSAEATAGIAQSMIAGERAYVFFLDTVRFKEVKALAYKVIWKNFGRTPAMVTGVRLGVVAGDEPPDPADMPKYEMPLGAIIGADLGANKGWPRGQVSMTHVLKNSEAGDGLPIWLAGEITYRDIHGQSRRTWFCRRYVGDKFLLDADIDGRLNGYE